MAAINLSNEDELLEFQTNGTTRRAPAGNCGVKDASASDCTDYGRISDETLYQRPREYFSPSA